MAMRSDCMLLTDSFTTYSLPGGTCVSLPATSRGSRYPVRITTPASGCMRRTTWASVMPSGPSPRSRSVTSTSIFTRRSSSTASPARASESDVRSSELSSRTMTLSTPRSIDTAGARRYRPEGLPHQDWRNTATTMSVTDNVHPGLADWMANPVSAWPPGPRVVTMSPKLLVALELT